MRPSALSCILVSVVLIGAVTGAACSQPPEKERGQAEGAVAAARAAAAEVYAPDELLAAETALAEYDTAVAQGDYRAALNAALAARDRGYAAVTRASTAKAEARGRAERLVVELETLTTQISQRLAGTTLPRITGTGAQRLRPAVAAASTALQEARTAIEDGQFPLAIPQLEEALQVLRREFESVSGRGRS